MDEERTIQGGRFIGPLKRKLHPENSDPIIYCVKCGMERNCMLHLRAEFPPDAARKWMKKHHKNCDGELKYRAGFSSHGPIVGQNK